MIKFVLCCFFRLQTNLIYETATTILFYPNRIVKFIVQKQMKGESKSIYGRKTASNKLKH